MLPNVREISTAPAKTVSNCDVSHDMQKCSTSFHGNHPVSAKYSHCLTVLRGSLATQVTLKGKDPPSYWTHLHSVLPHTHTVKHTVPTLKISTSSPLIDDHCAHHNKTPTPRSFLKMAPNLSEDEIDDLIYFARAGEVSDLTETLTALSTREAVSPAEILLAARDSGKSTCLHMATGNGNLGKFSIPNLTTLFSMLLYSYCGSEITTLLLSHFTKPEQKTAFLDAPNEFGNTGLHWAALGGHLSVVKFLVDQGSGVGVANDKGYIPLDLASFGEKMEVVDYFLASMKETEGENGEGLGSAAGGLELEEGVAGEEEEAEAEDAGASKPSSSS